MKDFMRRIGDKVIIHSNRSGIKKYSGQIGTLIDIQEKTWSSSGRQYYIVQIGEKTIRLLSEKEMEFIEDINNETQNNKDEFKHIENECECYMKYFNCYYEKFKQFDDERKQEGINTLMDMYKKTNGIVQLFIGKVIMDLQMPF